MKKCVLVMFYISREVTKRGKQRFTIQQSFYEFFIYLSYNYHL